MSCFVWSLNKGLTVFVYFIDDATQSSADEMSFEESVVSKNTAPDGDNHRISCSIDMPGTCTCLTLFDFHYSFIQLE